jgi:hypothetical protein
MSATGPDCREARLHIGAAPHELPAAIETHVAGCATCQRFLDETRGLDGRVRQALEVPLARFRERAAPRRRFAMAASVVLAVMFAGGLWLLRPQTVLAGEVARHVQHEAFSWSKQDLLPSSELAAVLREAKIEIDPASLPVVYASACAFRGRVVPHFVVRTASGPVTVMLLAHEKVFMRSEFSEAGLRGVLIPVRGGSVALLTQGGSLPEALAGEISAGVRW